MSGLFTQLLPELVGLVVTPAAIVACLLLLDSSRPVANVAMFAVAFLFPYVVISVVVVASSSSVHGSQDAQDAKDWISVALGVLFLLGAALAILARARRRRSGLPRRTPAWIHTLEDPGPRTLVLAALALAAVNPNLAILLSGLAAVVAAEVSDADRVLGVVLLLGACLLDFLVPTLVYLLLGERARWGLHSAKDWLIVNNRVIGVVVLLVFGVLFVSRGLSGSA